MEIETNFNSNSNQADSIFKEQPVPLIDFESEGFVVNEEALRMLKSIEDEVIVVSVVGKARTGKSFLMNLLLDNLKKSKGFEVDSTIASCTKGIWMWGNYRQKEGTKTKILFIDSEGTSSVDRSTKTYDAKIFALVVLISSLFIYNTTNNIDEHGISELALAAQLSSSIASKVDKEALITEMSPKFIWLIRDFSLDMVDPDTGRPISSKEYLDVCLRKKISGKNSSDNNSIRENILKFFPDRDCYTLVRPADSEDELRNLNSIEFNKLKSEFRSGILELKNKIFRETTSKRIKGKKLNGLSLANLIVDFVNAINKGAVPNINNAWDSVIKKDIDHFYEKSIKSYRDLLKNVNEIMDNDHLIKLLYDFKVEAFMTFNQLFNLNQEVFNNSEYMSWSRQAKRDLEDEIERMEAKCLDKNINESNKLCKELVKSSYKTIYDKTINSKYSSKNVEEYLKDFDRFLNNYAENAKGPNKLKILTDFLTESKPDFYKTLMKTIETENQNKLNEVLVQVKEYEEKNIDLEEQNKKLRELTELSQTRIANLQSEIGKKDRDINDLSERIKKIEEDIKNKRKEQLSKIKNEAYQSRVSQERNLEMNERLNPDEALCNCLIF